MGLSVVCVWGGGDPSGSPRCLSCSFSIGIVTVPDSFVPRLLAVATPSNDSEIEPLVTEHLTFSVTCAGEIRAFRLALSEMRLRRDS
jgi:hypothetical protein